MEVQNILSEIDAEISKLTQVRNMLSGLNGGTSVRRKPGRPKGATVQASQRTGMSPEARARISEAMKARWASKKSGPKKSATKPATK
jgi:hypothetical protein